MNLLNRRSFLRFSSCAALSLPTGTILADEPSRGVAWGKPLPALGAGETWVGAAWQDAYKPEDFAFVKPSVQFVNEHTAAIVWKTHERAYGWAEVSQDGGKTWRIVWSERDGIRDVNTRSHCALVEDYDMTKPLRFRAVSRPIAEYSRWGEVRFQGETMTRNKYGGRDFAALAKSRAEKYAGLEYVDEGEMPAHDPDSFAIVMFNDTHHVLSAYPKLLDALGEKKIDLAVFAGDICDHARSEEDFDRYLAAPMAYLTQRCGAMTRFVRGNHECMGLYAPFVRNHCALQDDRLYGAATVGGARLLFLDTGDDTPPQAIDPMNPTRTFRDMEHYFRREAKWLKREIASEDWRKAKMRISFSHVPPTHRWHPEHALRMSTLYAPLATANLTLHCAGHTHYAWYERPTAERPYALFVGGGPEMKPNPKCNGRNVFTLSRLTLTPTRIALRQVSMPTNQEFYNEVMTL